MDALIHAFGIDWKLILVQGVNFAVLAVLLTVLLYRPVLKIVREREEFITKGVRDAEAATALKEKLEVDRVELLKAAESEAKSVVAATRETAEVLRKDLRTKAEEEAARVLKDAELRAAEDLRAARVAGQREAARLALLAAERLLKEKQSA